MTRKLLRLPFQIWRETLYVATESSIALNLVAQTKHTVHFSRENLYLAMSLVNAIRLVWQKSEKERYSISKRAIKMAARINSAATDNCKFVRGLCRLRPLQTWERKHAYLGGQIFKNCSTVNSGSRSNTAMTGRSVLQMSVNTTDGELQNGKEQVERHMKFD